MYLSMICIQWCVCNTILRKPQKPSGESSNSQLYLCTRRVCLCCRQFRFLLEPNLFAHLWDESLIDGCNPFIRLWILVLPGVVSNPHDALNILYFASESMIYLKDV